MIIEFKVSNYRSINAEQTLSFVAENARRHPDNLIPRKGYKLLKAVGLFGANASGKSNLVKALRAMREFVRDSATRMNDGDPIPAAEPYRLEPATRDAPSRFEITFVTDGLMYTYGFAADRQRVHEEWLTAKSESTERELFGFNRDGTADAQSGKWKFRGTLIDSLKLLDERTRDNALALSVSARENVKEILPAYRYLSQRTWIFDMSAGLGSLLERATLFYQKESMHNALSSLLLAADTGVEDVRIEPRHRNSLPEITPQLSEEDRNTLKVLNDIAASASGSHLTTMRYDSSGNEIYFDLLADESQGTQRFIALLGLLTAALFEGTLVVLDEMDASMHPLLTHRLLEMFQSAEANPNGAQLLFTTHDSALLDQELFRRDQIWLAEKCNGASTFFSLSDIRPPIRNTESFLRNYLTGRYGGTPYLGRAFSLLEVAPLLPASAKK